MTNNKDPELVVDELPDTETVPEFDLPDYDPTEFELGEDEVVVNSDYDEEEEGVDLD